MEANFNLQRKVSSYKDVLANTVRYRAAWKSELRELIVHSLRNLAQGSALSLEISVREDLDNLGAVVCSLGHVESGISERLGVGVVRNMIKQNGSLIYQQLFNGKILVLINYPYIEQYGQPQPPKTVAIYRPEELRDAYFQRHLELLLQEVTAWEDYDDDVPEPNQRIGFKMNFDQKGS